MLVFSEDRQVTTNRKRTRKPSCVSQEINSTKINNIMRGFLKKICSNRNWCHRYFELSKSWLYYSSSQTRRYACAVFNLEVFLMSPLGLLGPWSKYGRSQELGIHWTCLKVWDLMMMICWYFSNISLWIHPNMGDLKMQWPDYEKSLDVGARPRRKGCPNLS